MLQDLVEKVGTVLETDIKPALVEFEDAAPKSGYSYYKILREAGKTLMLLGKSIRAEAAVELKARNTANKEAKAAKK